ncbi:hypothetical protein ACNPM2_03870 [Stenotrophomonas geniculata]|uniref:hypothetical protein n=1 Tax=Stenotrophomonas geniculata TaxID=86188 RepID=UPI003AAF92A7
MKIALQALRYKALEGFYQITAKKLASMMEMRVKMIVGKLEIHCSTRALKFVLQNMLDK